LKEHLDSILAEPSRIATLDFSAPGHSQEQWSWCDSLFMAPPTWIRLYAATGDERYLNFAVTNWWWTTGYLYDTNYHLYFCDTAFYTYALTWGVNQGLLDRAKFEPAVLKGWASLVSCVDADGKVTHVQPIGADPKSFDVTTNLAYGTGAFLLAGSEIYRMEV